MLSKSKYPASLFNHNSQRGEVKLSYIVCSNQILKYSVSIIPCNPSTRLGAYLEIRQCQDRANNIVRYASPTHRKFIGHGSDCFVFVLEFAHPQIMRLIHKHAV